MKLHRIAAICHPQNKASAKVMEKAGMKYEGLFKEHVFIKDRWCDSLGYAIVKQAEAQRRLRNTVPAEHNL